MLQMARDKTSVVGLQSDIYPAFTPLYGWLSTQLAAFPWHQMLLRRPERRGNLTPERWSRIEEVVHSALEHDERSRAAYLNNVCGDDAALRAEVESLLAFDGEAPQAIAGIVQGSAALFDAGRASLAVGERVGAYRVVREIGRGGMGTVYLAERDDEQFHKRVAIKLVTRGMDTAALLERFRHERRILARLEHPYIARLLDAASTRDGRPYLTLEYIDGKPITAYCAEKKLPTRERIELSARFAPPCRAPIRTWWSTGI